MAGTITVDPPLPPCNNDGQVELILSFIALNAGSNGYQILVDGELFNTLNYEGLGTQQASILVPGDGLLHNIQIVDADFPECSIFNEIQIPNCDVNAPCALNLTATQISDCDINNQIEVSLNITSSNTGTNGF